MKIYLVGGAVRDIGWGITPRDYDYCVVGAVPEDLIKLGFEQVGQDFPVFLHPKTGEEYALARRERKNVAASGGFDVDTEGVSIEEDLRRRDFTINSMAIEVNMQKDGTCKILNENNIIDPYGGRIDLKNKTLRHTSTFFREDPLRILRGCRIAAVYNLTVAPETHTLMCDMVQKQELKQITQPRIFLEFKKAFAYPKTSEFLNNLCSVGLENYITYLRPVSSNALNFLEQIIDNPKHPLYPTTLGFETQLKSILAFYSAGLSPAEYVKNHVPPSYNEFIVLYNKFQSTFQDYPSASAAEKLFMIKSTKAQHVNYLANILFIAGFCETQNTKQYEKNISFFEADIAALKAINYEELLKGADKKSFAQIIKSTQEQALSEPSQALALTRLKI